jgi:hypothetical protein
MIRECSGNSATIAGAKFFIGVAMRFGLPPSRHIEAPVLGNDGAATVQP